MRLLLIFFCIYILSPPGLQAKEIVTIATVAGSKQAYDELVEEKGGNPFVINNFQSITSRPAISLLIIHQALHAGGIESEFQYIFYPNIARSLIEIKRGKVQILATDIWEQNFDDQVYKTAPFIRKGDFEKGIYTHKDSPLLKTKPDLKQLLQYTPLTESAWAIDINALHMMGFSKIVTAPEYHLLLKMLTKKRADFALLEFSRRPTMAHTTEDGFIYPIKGVKILLPYSRHFMVSKKHPDGKKIYEALERGLKILRENGTIEKALYQSGIKDERVRDWKAIWPEKILN